MSKMAATATASSDTVAELICVGKYFEQRRPAGPFKRERVRIDALLDASMRVERGEFVAYAGPNGAGKSTTFKLLCGMLAPQSGSVRVFGADPARDRIAIMRKTGVLFGNRSELWWDHPVRASFAWKKVVWEVPDDAYRRMLAEVCELLDLNDFLDSFARELSLGQRMRANLGLTLLHEPDLLLLDEPTLGLDVLAKRQMIEFLKRINRELRTTILVTSHDMDDLAEMTRRIVLINKGRIAFDGGYEALMRQTGDRHFVRLSAPGSAPRLPGARLTGQAEGRYTYEYEAGATPVSALLRAIADLPGAADVETGRAPIESVIARLYESWR